MPMDSASVLQTQAEVVSDRLPVLFERDDKFYTKAIKKRKAETISFRDFRIPAEMGPGMDFAGFDSDGGDLGRGESSTFDKFIVPAYEMRGACEWTAKADWGTDDSRKGVLRAFKHLVAKAMAEFRRQLDAQCMTDGTGVLGVVSSVSTSGGVDTVVLTSTYGVRLVRKRQRVQVFDTTLATNRTAGGPVRITYHDEASNTIKFAAVTGITAGDKIMVYGPTVTAGTPTWLTGVPYSNNSASTGSWYGMSRSTTPEIRASRVNAGGPLALPFARLAMNKVGSRIGEESVGNPQAWMHPCQKGAYEELGQLVTMLNAMPGSQKSLDLYFGGAMQMAGAPVEQHHSWPKDRIDFIFTEYWGRAEITPVDFYKTKDGRLYFEARGASGGVATANMFYIVAIWNMFSYNPAGGVYIDGLTIPSGY